MATAYKVLGQAAPALNTWVDLYTVPSGAQTVCSTLAVCARTVTAGIYVAVRPAGATLADQHYVIANNWVDGGDTVFLTLGITLAATDVLSVKSDQATVSYNLFGSEIT